MYEIVLTRIFSVTMWYHFAFVAISVALFGLTVGALLVYLFPRWFRDRDDGETEERDGDRDEREVVPHGHAEDPSPARSRT